MKIFVGYGYNDRDKWVESYVFDLIRAFGAEPIAGKEIPGEKLEDGVRQTIKTSDALLGFATRRAKMKNGKYTTHQWVKDEIITALESSIPFIEVREKCVDPQLGMAGGRQYLVYEPSSRDLCLVELAKAIGKWTRNLPVKLQLLPESVTQAIRPFIGKPGFRCSYRVLQNGVESRLKETSLTPQKGGLFVLIPGLNPLALIQISVEAVGKQWNSDYESVDAVSIKLQEF